MTRIGIVGTGNMANAYHARILDSIDGVAIAACCDQRPDALREFAERWSVEKTYSDYKTMLDSEELDGICIVAPDAVHAEVSICALERSVSALCEKPMAATLDEARQMVAAAKKTNAINMVNYSKRDFSGLRGAKEYIDSGAAGRIMHVESSYLQGWLSGMDWSNPPPGLLWRMSDAHSEGDLGDLGCHIYDMASFLCGEITSITCTLKSYDKPIDGNKFGEYLLDANDSFVSSVEFANGALGAIQSTRWATGYPNREFIRVYGDKATVELDSDRGRDRYRYIGLGEEEWTGIEVPTTPTNVERFVESIRSGVNDPSDFESGFRIQAYLDASIESSRTGNRVAVARASTCGKYG